MIFKNLMGQKRLGGRYPRLKPFGQAQDRPGA